MLRLIGELEHDPNTLTDMPLTDISEDSRNWDIIVKNMQGWVTELQKDVTNIKVETKKYREFFI
jgi:hypothetical protein